MEEILTVEPQNNADVAADEMKEVNNVQPVNDAEVVATDELKEVVDVQMNHAEVVAADEIDTDKADVENKEHSQWAQNGPEEDDIEKKQKAAELEKYWSTVEDNPMDFTGWTYLLQYVEQEVVFFLLSFVLLNSDFWSSLCVHACAHTSYSLYLVVAKWHIGALLA